MVILIEYIENLSMSGHVFEICHAAKWQQKQTKLYCVQLQRTNQYLDWRKPENFVLCALSSTNFFGVSLFEPFVIRILFLPFGRI